MNGNTRFLLRRVIVGFVIWVCLLSAACVFVFVYISFYARPFHLGLCDAAAFATVWLDSNGNGVEDNNELPFTGACLWANSSYPKLDVDIHSDPVCNDDWDYSDENGSWGSLMFSCYEDVVFVSVKPPAGFKSSTIPVVVSEGQEIAFGLAPESTILTSEIRGLEYYSDRLRNDSVNRTNRNRFFLLGFIFVSLIFSWLLARRLVKLR